MLKDLMSKKVIVVEPDAKVSAVAKVMADEDVGSVLVLDNDQPRGILTDRDIVVRCIAKNVDVEDCTVENIMTECLATVKETDSVFDCIEMMHGASVRRIPVVNELGKTVGIVSASDVLSVLSREFEGLTRQQYAPKGSAVNSA